MSGYGDFEIPNDDLTWMTDQEVVMGSTDRPAEAPDGVDGDTINRMPKELLDNTQKNLDNLNELDVRLQGVKNIMATSAEIQALQNDVNALVAGTPATPITNQAKLYLIPNINHNVVSLGGETWTLNSGAFSAIPLDVKAIFGMYTFETVVTGPNYSLLGDMLGKVFFDVAKSDSSASDLVGSSGFFMASDDGNDFSSIPIGYAGVSVGAVNISYNIMGYLK